MKCKSLLLALGCYLFLSLNASAQGKKYAYKDRSKPVTTRVADLMKRMTLSEKIDQLRHVHSENYDGNGKPDMQKLTKFTKGNSFGCIEGLGLTAEQYAKTIYTIQQYMLDSTRLGIPIIPVLEGLHGIVQDGGTIYPQSIAIASTFWPELAFQMSVNIGKEVKAMGAKQVLAPDLDLARELRWGRVEETYGEDPYLVGEMGLAYVKGLNAEHIIPTLKHFVAHGTPIGGINLSAVAGGLRDLYSLYVPPFAKVIAQGQPLSVMNCYSSYDNEPIAGSKFFLTDLLRKQLGFKGYVYSDWGSIDMLYYFHHTAAGAADAAFQAITAGLDLEAASSAYENLDSLVKCGKLDVRYIDAAVNHVLIAKFKSGLFDDPLPDTSSSFKSKIHTAESAKLSRTIADESIVLLKNENNLLPFDAGKIKSIAIIGPNADETEFGDYTWSNTNGNGTTPLEGIQKLVGKNVSINYAKGCEITGLDSSKFAEAVKAAEQSDVVVVFAGSRSAALAKESLPAVSGEGFDLDNLHLPGVQEQLIQTIQRTGKPVVLVLVTGRPFVLSWEAKNIPAIAVQWYGGEEEGNAIAAMLFGETNPSGKLPVSFPKSTGNLPAYYNYHPSERGYYRSPGTEEKPGRDYVFAKPGALWPFGYGLSYTKFDFKGFAISKQKVLKNDTVSVSIKIKNTGNMDGAEVVQLYVRDLVSSVETPVQALKAFEKVFLKKGEEQMVTLQLPVSELYLYNRDMQKVVEPGDFEIQVGAASNDIKSKGKITVFDSKKAINESSLTSKEKQATVRSKDIQNDKAVNHLIQVSGIIRNVQAGVISGVTVKSKTKGTTVVSDNSGKFIIDVPANDTLIFSKTGSQTKNIAVNANTNINVSLSQSSF
jgi:beta-glucosidase